METKKLIEKLREKAKRSLDHAKMLAEKEDYTWAIFMLEQSLQLLLKSKLLEEFGDFPKTHDIRILLTLLSEKISKLKSYINKVEVDILNEAYISSRYSIMEFGEESYKRCLEFVEEIWKILS